MSAGAGRVGRKLRRAHAVGDLLADRPIDRVVVVGALGHVGERQAVIRLRLGVGRRGGGAAGNRQRVAGRGFVIVVAASRRRSDDCRADTNDRHLAGRGIDLCNRFIAAFIGNLAERLILVHSQLVREIRRANALAHRLGLIGNVPRSLGDGEHGRAGDRHAALGGLPIDCHRANVRQCNDIVGIRALTAGLVLDVHTLSGSRFDLDAVLLAVIGDGEAVRRGGEFVIQSIGLRLLTAVVTGKGDGKLSVRGTDRIVRALHKLGAVVDHADIIKVRPCGSVVGIAIADTNDFDGLTAHILRSHSDSLRIQRLVVPREDDLLLTSLRSLPKTMKNLGYYVAPEDVGVEMRSIASQHPEVLSAPRRDLDLIEPGYYLEAIGAFRGFIQDIQKARPKLEEQQIHAEMEIEDLLHAAEFYDLACDQGFDIYQRLREARIRRRNCKNAVAWIDFVLDANPDEFLRHDPSPRISGTQHRQYRPRALPELFEELSSLS